MEKRKPFQGWAINGIRRACHECNKKKAKCDVLQPVCGRCQRVGMVCTFPTSRKKPDIRSRPSNAGRCHQAQQRGGLTRAKPNRGRDLTPPGTQTYAPPSLLDKRRKPTPQLGDEYTAEELLVRSCAGSLSSPAEAALFRGPENSGSPQYRSRPRLDSLSTSDNLQSCQGLPPEVALELVDIFFEKVQAWLPLLHRPTFFKRFLVCTNSRRTLVEELSLEQKFIFKGIFALTARYSTSPFYDHVPPLQRGSRFAAEAMVLYQQARSSIDVSALTYLQGCILLAFYYYTSGPCPEGWVLTGVCVRLAYDLDLDKIDEDEVPVANLDTEEWVHKEERRRTWWLVWELDTFGSTVSTRPYTIDRRRIAVLLPCSDEAWFAMAPIPSARLETEPSRAWKSLQGCANQDERAWFLIANFLVSISHDLSQRRQGVSEDDKLELEHAFCCFQLALPSSFHLGTGVVGFGSTNFARSNWIIATHLMMTSARLLVSSIRTENSPSFQSPSLSRHGQLQSWTAERSRIIRQWSPEIISLSHPFIACAILAPVYVPGGGADLDLSPSNSACHDMPRLVLSHYARVWRLGHILLKISTILEDPQKTTPGDFTLVRRFALYFPTTLKTWRTLVSTPDHASTKQRAESCTSPNTRFESPTYDGLPVLGLQSEVITPAQVAEKSISQTLGPPSRPIDFTDLDVASARYPSLQSPPFAPSSFAQGAVNWDDRGSSWETTTMDFFGELDDFGLDYLIGASNEM